MAEITTFNGIGGTAGTIAANVVGSLTGDVTGSLTGLLKGVTLSKSAAYTLKDDERVACVIITASVAIALTLGIGDDDVMLVYNVGSTNAVTVKNLSEDTGTSVGAGKVALVWGSETENGTKVIVLN